ncbi:DUF4132 domain-containing protein [Actinoplanes bogorensis]|uniref:DUF4132 domain-containing protein n=1 Tax=Paractinoplanes bogorensis TaxID=1610840 RepID=A0ABS5YUH2_9ACTN|nr:DUF4132 domain-containing protein [Actinoplanes bogorensis]MBU2667105.1 DUF4132 domain-containing protein [Actinoplanes bogorensis]
MRSFEFVEGTSAKFWAITRDGLDVTVRYGRVGTNGQTKVKSFGTSAGATDHEAKLIAEKVRKGYKETTVGVVAAGPDSSPPPASTAPAPAAGSDAAPVPAARAVLVEDEDSFVLPATWKRYRAARRDRDATPVTPDPKSRAIVEKLLSTVPRYSGKQADFVWLMLGNQDTEPNLATGGLAWLKGEPGVTPGGAAAVALATAVGNWGEVEKLSAFADEWLAHYGLLFAVDAASELFALKLRDQKSYGAQPAPVVHMSGTDSRAAWRVDAALVIGLRVRSMLAGAPDEDYAAAVALLARKRADGRYQRAATSLIAPTETAWVDEDFAAAAAAQDSYLCAVTLLSATTAAQIAQVGPLAQEHLVVGSMTMLTTLLDGAGVDASTQLFAWLDRDFSDADARRRLLMMVAGLPTDEAMAGLIERVDGKYVQPALLEAAARFPARALRLLAASPARKVVPDLLRAHVLAHRDLTAHLLPQLDPGAAARVQSVVDSADSVVEAPAGAVPPLLTNPPWTNRKRAAKPAVIGGLTAQDPPALIWRDGEEKAWRETSVNTYGNSDRNWPQIAERVRDNRAQWHEATLLFAEGPEAIALPVLNAYDPRDLWDVNRWMRVAVARFGLRVLPAVLTLARRSATEMAEVIQPLAAPEIAVLAADWLARLKSVRKSALAWLLRHPAYAARALVPNALGVAGVARRQAEQALLALAANGHSDAVRAAGAAYGAGAAEAIETLLSTDPLAVLPARMPSVPAWATPGLLPPVRLRDGSGALPADAITNLVTVFALGKPGEPYAGVALVKQACDPESLAEFGWGMFQRWQATGGNSKENWALDALGLIGDDETVRRLTPMILAWPGEGGHQRAVTGVQILADIGTDVALMHLHGIAQRAKFKGLKAAANQKMDEVAEALGLTAEQLADRLVPDFALAADGSMILDYGPRQFTVGFDEQLRPYVADASGKHLKALPKPGVRDDAELAPAAFKQFSALKKDVRTVATDQIRRLERAMVTGRRWTGDEFQRLFVDHPLVWHVVRRLVWGVYTDGALTGSVRVAEDRTYADAQDEPVELAADATVGVAHPLHLGDTLPDWAEVFADYEILQPFPQLSRETFALTEPEAAGLELTRFQGAEVPTGKVIGLERKGWLRELPQDGGVQGHIAFALAAGTELRVDLDPGIAVGAMDIFPEQKLQRIWLYDGTGNYWRREGSLPLGRLDAVAASELIRDLTEVTA